MFLTSMLCKNLKAFTSVVPLTFTNLSVRQHDERYFITNQDTIIRWYSNLERNMWQINLFYNIIQFKKVWWKIRTILGICEKIFWFLGSFLYPFISDGIYCYLRTN